MIIEQIVNECLAAASYYIECNGEAAIIDPVRDVSVYLDKAGKRHATIRYVFMTHFHADFVSGQQEIARATGATIVFGPTAAPLYMAHIAKDNEVFSLGKINIQLLHTPGHTLESSCYLLLNEGHQPTAIFSGDTLLLGEAGRPDLVKEVRAEFSPEFLAGLQFDAIHNKIDPLPDSLMIYPGHLQGSPCSREVGGLSADTLGNQRRSNKALDNTLNREQYIVRAIENLPDAPPHFAFNVLLNQQGGLTPMSELVKRSLTPIAPGDFFATRDREEALIIDTRNRYEFPDAFIPGALFFGLEENFSRWVGTIINNLQQPILLVAAPGKETEVIRRLSLIGNDRVIGYLDGGMDAWMQARLPTDSIDQVSAEAFADLLKIIPSSTKILDLRAYHEYQAAHVKKGHSFPLEHLQRNKHYLDKDAAYFLYCATGYRSLIAASCMKASGFHSLTHIIGGISALKKVKNSAAILEEFTLIATT